MENHLIDKRLISRISGTFLKNIFFPTCFTWTYILNEEISFLNIWLIREKICYWHIVLANLLLLYLVWWKGLTQDEMKRRFGSGRLLNGLYRLKGTIAQHSQHPPKTVRNENCNKICHIVSIRDSALKHFRFGHT